jgi:hypothetical protein
MAIELTEQQQHELDTTEEYPPRVVDPRTNTVYILIPEAKYVANTEDHQEKAIRAVGRRNAIGKTIEGTGSGLAEA